MQFLENSVIGLRAARWTLKSPSHDAEVTLFPMAHLGEAQFYEDVYRDALSHDHILFEGVNAPAGRHLTRSYRWIRPEALGLVVQPRLEADHSGLIHADLSPEAFQALWRDLPLAVRALTIVASAGVALSRRYGMTRARLAQGLCTHDLSSREDIYARGGRLAPLIELIQSARDAQMCRVLLEQLEICRGQGARVALVYGAAHMAAASRALGQAHGFRPADSEWLTVFAK